MKQSFFRSQNEYEEIDVIVFDMILFCGFILFLAVYIFSVTI